MSIIVDVKGLDKAALLAALYNNAKMQGKGISHPEGSIAMSVEEARELLRRHGSFDYLNGRVLKLYEFGDDVDTLDVWLYNRDNGEGKAQRVIDNLRATGSVDEII